ncbi:MAG: pilus assembly protein [Cyanobacteria bacterium P01_G01_bin.49]
MRTFSEEFIPEEEQDFEEDETNYPTAFGITFTPQVSGISLAVLGVLSSAYILLNLVMPAYDNYNTLKADEAAKQSQIEQQKSGKLDTKMIESEQKLRESKALRAQVLSLFSSEQSLKTLLLDVDKLVEKHQAKLLSFQPDGSLTVINDASLGEGVNNRLKRQRFTLTIEGGFGQTQSLLRDLERLQPLLLVQKLNSKLVEEQFTIEIVDVQQEGGEVIAQGQATTQGQDKVETSFILDAILPLSPEEVADLAPKPEEGQ